MKLTPFSVQATEGTVPLVITTTVPVVAAAAGPEGSTVGTTIKKTASKAARRPVVL